MDGEVKISRDFMCIDVTENVTPFMMLALFVNFFDMLVTTWQRNILILTINLITRKNDDMDNARHKGVSTQAFENQLIWNSVCMYVLIQFFEIFIGTLKIS